MQTTPPSTPVKARFFTRNKIIAIVIILVVVVAGAVGAYYLSRPNVTWKVDVGSSPQIRYLVFNVKTAPYNDIRLRQGIAYAVDRGAINTNVFNSLTSSLYSMVPPAMPFSQPVFQSKYGSTPNMAQAQALLSQLVPSGQSTLGIDLWYNSDGHYGPTEPAVAQLIKSQLEATGKLSVTLHSEPWATYTNDFGNGKLPFFLLGWYPDYFDSDDYVSPFLGTSGASSLGSEYSNATVDTWLAQEANVTDATQRGAIFSNIQNQLATDVPYIPLWEGTANIVYDKDMTGVYLHPVTFKYDTMAKPGATQITVGTTDRISSLDPASGYDYFSIEVMNQVFDTLLLYEPQTTNLVPGLATTIPTVANGGISTNSSIYTFHLRTGVTFQDGTAFNSTVMKWSIERAMNINAAGSAAFLLYDVGGLNETTCSPGFKACGATITTPDANTIVFHLDKPVSFFNEIMAFSVSAPVSKAAYSATTIQTDAVGKVIGTGPYKLTGYTANQQVVLQANANYYNPGVYSTTVPSFSTVPILNQITINQYSDSTGLKNAVTAHQVNMAYRTLTPTDVTSLQG